MRKARMVGALLMSAVLAWAAGGAGGSGAERILSVALEEVLSIGTLDDGALVQWTGIAADRSGGIYVLDSLDYAIKKFDSRGRLIQKAGRKGQGPGEFISPRALALSGDHLLVLDQSRAGLLIFGTDLRYQGAIPAAQPWTMIVPLASGRMAVAGLSNIGQPARISTIDSTGRILSGFSFLEKVRFYLADSITAAADADGNLFIAYFYQDRIEKRDPRGAVLWNWSLAGSETTSTQTLKLSDREIQLPSKTFYKDVALDRQGHVLVLCGGQTKHPSRDVYVFDPAGTRQAMFTLPEASHCVYVDDRGFLYVRANEGLTVKKYRLVYHTEKIRP
jgi:hypothetical protein